MAEAPTKYERGWRLSLTFSLLAHLALVAWLVVVGSSEDIRGDGASAPIVVALVQDTGLDGEAGAEGQSQGARLPHNEAAHGKPERVEASQPVRSDKAKTIPVSEEKREKLEKPVETAEVHDEVSAVAEPAGREQKIQVDEEPSNNAGAVPPADRNGTGPARQGPAGNGSIEAAEAFSGARPSGLGPAVMVIEPEYPRRSRELGEEGTVVLRVVMGSGRTSIEIRMSSGYRRLDRAAVKAVEESLYGWKAPVSFTRTVNVKFKLEEER